MSIITQTKMAVAQWLFKSSGLSILLGGSSKGISDTAVRGRQAYKRNGYLARGINVKADAVVSVPLKVYTEKEIDGKPEREEVRQGELVDLLAKPNPLMTSSQFWQSHLIEHGLMGNSVWYFPSEFNNKRIVLLKADEFRVKPTDDGYDIAAYERLTKSGFTPVDPKQIIHFREPNPFDKWLGLSVTEVLVRAILSAWYIGEWNNNFFKDGAIPPGLLTTEHAIDLEKAKTYGELWHAQHSGKEKWQKIAVIGAGLKFEQISQAHKDMAFEALCRWDREEILAYLGVPPAMVGVMEYANYANAEAQKKMFWESTVMPLLRYNESVINEMLIPRLFPGKGWFVEYDTSNVKALQDDADKKAARDQIYVNTGVLTVNEVRADMNREPVDWGDEPPSGGGSLAGLLSGETPAMFKSLEQKDDPEVEARKALWKAFDRKLTMRESKFAKIMRDYFIDQKKRLLAAIEGEYKSIKEPPRPINVEEIMALFVAAYEMLKLQEMTTTTISDILSMAGKEAIDKLGVDVAFDLSHPAVIDGIVDHLKNPTLKDWVDQLMLNMAAKVTDESQSALKRLLSNAVDNGDSIQEISKQIGEMFDGFADYRATRTARTEVISAHNQGALSGYVQSDVVEGKEWLSTLDGETRESHAAANGQVVDVGAHFSVSGILVQYPGDPGLPPEERINCRCTVLPVKKETE